MEIEDDELAGITVKLDFDDDLAEVPESHQHLLSEEVRNVFANPRQHFVHVRDSAPVPNMKKWFEKVLNDGFGELWLENGDPHAGMARAGFFLGNEKVLPAIVGLPQPVNETIYPERLKEMFRLVGFIDWTGLMYGGQFGGLATPTEKPTMLSYFNYTGSEVDPVTSGIIGGSLCGDQMICTIDGRGGWWKHETGEVEVHGSIEDFVDWIFGELLESRAPESDTVYRRKKRK